MYKISEYLKYPSLIILGLMNHGLFDWMNDHDYLALKYKMVLKQWIDFKNPTTFNEKIQWLKLYDKNPSYTKMVDKYAAKMHVTELIGSEHIVPNYGVWDSFEDIDFNQLPRSFVLKCTHDSGGLIIVVDKNNLDINGARTTMDRFLNRNFYFSGREWPYKHVKPRIIAEEYLTDESGTELKDYKIFNFHGEPKLIQVDYNRFSNHKRNLYDTEWNYIDAQLQYPSEESHIIPKPRTLQLMLRLARELSKGIPFVRTDFYSIENKVYFGEMTFYPGGGFEKFYPKEWDYILGSWLDLSCVERSVDRN